MFRSANGVQLCIYSKTEQAGTTDRLDYWESVWKRGDSFDDDASDNHNPKEAVWCPLHRRCPDQWLFRPLISTRF